MYKNIYGLFFVSLFVFRPIEMDMHGNNPRKNLTQTKVKREQPWKIQVNLATA